MYRSDATPEVAVHEWSTYELAQQRVRYFRYV